jgi:hypothetical protein
MLHDLLIQRKIKHALFEFSLLQTLDAERAIEVAKRARVNRHAERMPEGALEAELPGGIHHKDVQ